MLDLLCAPQAYDGKQDPECMMLEAALNDEEDQEVYYDVQAQVCPWFLPLSFQLAGVNQFP